MQTWYRVAAGAIGWFVIGLHYYLIASRPDVGLAEAASRMLSFFTILTDILVALAMTLPWLAPESKLGVFFSRPSVRTAITCYIIVVSAVYYAILRKLWNPEGLQYLADTIEHCVAPALYIVDWLRLCAEGDGLGKVGPMVAALSRGLRRFSLLHGAVTGFYPYPFLEVTQLGYERVLLNMGVLTAAFAVLGLILVGIDRLLGAVELRKAS